MQWFRMSIVQSFKDEVSLVHAKGYVCHGRYISISFFDFRFCCAAFSCTFKSTCVHHYECWVLNLCCCCSCYTLNASDSFECGRGDHLMYEHRSHCYCCCCCVRYFLWVLLSLVFFISPCFACVCICVCARACELCKKARKWVHKNRMNTTK